MPFIVTHEEWGVLVHPEYPAEWVPFSAPEALGRAKRFKWRTDAIRATRGWAPSIRTHFKIVEVDY